MTLLSGPLLSRTDMVLFDLDGTLLDTAPDLVNALLKVCVAENQPPPDFGLACRYVSTGAAGLIRLAFPKLDEDNVELLRQRLVQHYADNICELTRPFDGIPSVLAELEAAGKRWGIVTNKPTDLTESLMSEVALDGICACLVAGDTLPQRKPHPAPLLHALELTSVAASDSVYVGDAPQDIAAGRAAGMMTVAVSWGYIIPGENPHDWGADYTIDHSADLLKL
jgi:phosphoglycolate phosphatase